MTPSNLPDDAPGVTWLIGVIEEQTRNFKLEILKNRKLNTMKKFFKKTVLESTTVISDGHPSYSGAVNEIKGVHIVVNHSLGFRNQDGFTTNNIENLWSLIKYEIKKRKGILKVNLQKFLQEFSFRYCFLREKSSSEILVMFNEIMEFLFNKV